MRLFLSLMLLSPAIALAANVEKGSIVLLQPEISLQEKNPDVAAVSDYITEAQRRFSSILAPESLSKTSGFIVFAVRAGRKSNVWLDFKPALPPETEAKVLASIKAIPPFNVTKGTMVFAVQASVGGADLPTSPTPFPKEWQAAIAGNNEPIEVEALVQRVWP
jgi:hypothetical protein